MTIDNHLQRTDPAPQAVDPTTAELRDCAVRIRDDLTGLLADARRWADDVSSVVGVDDTRLEAAYALAEDVARGADTATAGVLWIDRYPLVPSRADWSDRPDWADDVRWPSETVQPAGAADLFNPAVHGDGQPWTWAEVEHARSVHEADVVARAGDLHARLDVLWLSSGTLAEDAVEWIDQADPTSQPDMYAGYKLFADTEHATGTAVTDVEAFEQDTLHAAQAPSGAVPSTAAMFAASSREVLTFAEDVQQRTHGWVDAVGQIDGHASAHYREVVAATDGVDQTVASVRHAARDFALFDNPSADDTPAPDTAAATAKVVDERAEASEEVHDRDDLAELAGSIAVDMDELAAVLTSLRDETTDWRHAGAVADAGDDMHRLEHAHNAGAELDDAVVAAQHGSWQASSVGYDRYSIEGATEAAELHTDQSAQRMLAGLVASLGDVEARLREGLDEGAAARVASDVHRAQHSLAWAAHELADTEVDDSSSSTHVAETSLTRQPVRGRVMGPDGQVSDQESVLRAADSADSREGGDPRPFELAESDERLDHSLAAAENGLQQIRAVQAAEHRRDADIARWHADDRAADTARGRTAGRALEADSEPPF